LFIRLEYLQRATVSLYLHNAPLTRLPEPLLAITVLFHHLPNAFANVYSPNFMQPFLFAHCSTTSLVICSRVLPLALLCSTPGMSCASLRPPLAHILAPAPSPIPSIPSTFLFVFFVLASSYTFTYLSVLLSILYPNGFHCYSPPTPVFLLILLHSQCLYTTPCPSLTCVII